MKIIFTFLLLATIGFTAQAQSEEVATFEEFELEIGEYLNGSDGTTNHEEIGINLPILYDTAFQAWTGWAISAAADTVTTGFTNQYSSITGGGVDGSQAYAVSYHYQPNELYYNPISTTGTIQPKLKGCYLTNSTYPYYSMLEGDMFAKKFGGADGNDPDFFSVMIRGYDENDELIDSVEFFLADYRFDDNSQDYIVNEWTFVDLSSLDGYSKMTFTMNSSDVGMFGVNTPSYFCMDNWTTELSDINSINDISNDIIIYPNPVSEILNVKVSKEFTAVIHNIHGQCVTSYIDVSKSHDINVNTLSPGIYTITVITIDGIGFRNFIRH